MRIPLGKVQQKINLFQEYFGFVISVEDLVKSFAKKLPVNLFYVEKW